MARKKQFRRSITWIIVTVWIGTSAAVFVAARAHPPARASISVSVRDISFQTNAKYILDQLSEKQLIVTGLGSMKIDFNSDQAASEGIAPIDEKSLELQGEVGASCSFYEVRSSRIQLTEPTIVALGTSTSGGKNAFNLRVNRSVSANLTSMPGTPEVHPGFTCTRARIDDKPSGVVERSLSLQGLDSIFFTTAPDARFDFVLADAVEVGNTQIPILDEIRFSSIDPGSSEEKTIILPAKSGRKNEIVFERPNSSIQLDDADLLVVVPDSDFTLRRFSIDDGIHLNFYGSVRDVRVGAAANDLVNRMPSYLDHLDDKKRVLGMIPALAALLIGILEKLGALPGK